jgi:hypothetical protein
MKTIAVTFAWLSLVLAAVAGCATRTASSQAASGETFTGEVWTWDDRENTVTLRRGGEIIRVKTTPDQMRGLQLHERATIRGQLAAPADLPVTTQPAPALSPVPKGPVDEQTLTGKVTAVDPSGRLSIDSEHGALHVWVAAGANERFAAGDRVQVVTSVQSVEMVPASQAGAAAVAQPSTSASGQPGDSAVVTGRIIGVDRGLLVVESPSGPIQVWAGAAPRYAVAQTVQVRTNVSKTP